MRVCGGGGGGKAERGLGTRLWFHCNLIFTILSGNHEFYRLQAGSEDEAVEWMRCIEASIQQDSVYDAFNQRKRRITSVQGLELPGFE